MGEMISPSKDKLPESAELLSRCMDGDQIDELSEDERINLYLALEDRSTGDEAVDTFLRNHEMGVAVYRDKEGQLNITRNFIPRRSLFERT